MLVLCCTEKTRKRFRLVAEEGDPPPRTNRLGYWYANLLNVGWKRYVLCVSAETYLPLLVPARNAEFPGRFGDHLRVMLRELGVAPEDAAAEAPAASDIVIARATDRHVLGVMNSMAQILLHVHEAGKLEDDPFAVSLWLSSLHHGPPPRGTPSAETRGRFDLAGRAPFGSEWMRPGDAAVAAVLAGTRRPLRTPDGWIPYPPAARLVVELEDVDPVIRRELWVDERSTLADLHRIFQAVMGWDDRHLYMFVAAGFVFVDPAAEMDGLDPRTMRLANLNLHLGEAFEYVYDFGDDWRCRVRLEERCDVRGGVQPLPELVSGERAGPPEDVGGPPGLAELHEALADPAHPEHEASREWVGARYDPERCDLEAVNAALARMVASGALDPTR